MNVSKKISDWIDQLQIWLEQQLPKASDHTTWLIRYNIIYGWRQWWRWRKWNKFHKLERKLFPGKRLHITFTNEAVTLYE